MKTAIVIGGTGLIGRNLVRLLNSKEIPVIVITSSPVSTRDCQLVKFDIMHIELRGTQEISSILTQIKSWPLYSDDCVVFNTAWRGQKGLQDGSLSQQLINVSTACRYLNMAAALGVKKYVLVGSMEEIIFERMLNRVDLIAESAKQFSSWYALAKTAAALQVSFEAYRSKVDLCRTRLSIVIDKTLCTPKFVESSFRIIYDNKIAPEPKSSELFNISSVNEIARQLYEVGKKGLNKSVYVLGTNECATLSQYFSYFSQVRDGRHSSLKYEKTDDSKTYLNSNDFDTGLLRRDTGYISEENASSLFTEICQNK